MSEVSTKKITYISFSLSFCLSVKKLTKIKEKNNHLFSDTFFAAFSGKMRITFIVVIVLYIFFNCQKIFFNYVTIYTTYLIYFLNIVCVHMTMRETLNVYIFSTREREKEKRDSYLFLKKQQQKNK